MKSLPLALEVVERAISPREKKLMQAGSFECVSEELLDQLAALYRFRDSVFARLENLSRMTSEHQRFRLKEQAEDDLPF